MAATVVTLTTLSPSAGQAAANDTMCLSVNGVTASGGAAIIEIADDGTNWVRAILGAPNGTTEIRGDGAFAFTVRMGWQWRASVVSPTAVSYSVRVAVE